MVDIRVVVVGPKFEGNVGAIARCMANFGVKELYLVNPCEIGDTAIALGNILERWKTIPGEPGAFTPSVLRHAGRCRKTMTREENRAWLAFLRRAWSKRFFMLREIHGNRRRTRWFLYLVSGRPGFLLQRFGFRWLLPFKWAKE